MKEMITPPDRLLVGDDVRGDDGFAVARTHRMQNAVKEGERGKGQRAGHGIVGLEVSTTLVASMRCKPCCLSSTKAKRLPSGTRNWNGVAIGGEPKQQEARHRAWKGVIGLSSACAA